MSTEVEFLRAKDAVFADADKATDAYKEQIQNLNLEIERLNSECQDNDFNIRVLNAENAVMKNNLVDGDTKLMNMTEELE